jgi:hypothetical protein
MKSPPKTRSPLRDRPLRNPGQWLDNQITLLRDDLVTKYFLPAVAFVVTAIWEWTQIFAKTRISPWLITAIALISIAYAVQGFVRTNERIAKLELARDGEMEVAEILDDLKRDGAAVIHDVQGEGFNIDHVIVSEHGLFAVETKTRSKPASPKATVSFDGRRVIIGGFFDEETVTHAEALSKWLVDLLLKSTGRQYWVRPVVVFPGWFVEPNPKGSHVWVLNPKALPEFVRHEQTQLSDPDLHLAAFHLSRYVRGTS